MTARRDDNATTWGDLSDQLTPAQIEMLERFEGTAAAPDAEAIAETLLGEAREHASRNLVDNIEFGHLAPPAGAAKLFHWDNGTYFLDEWSREFEGARRTIGTTLGKFTISIGGVQRQDGRVTRYLTIDGDDVLDSDDARQLAAALIEAADELERLQ
jgi:hypothetical protein